MECLLWPVSRPHWSVLRCKGHESRGTRPFSLESRDSSGYHGGSKLDNREVSAQVMRRLLIRPSVVLLAVAVILTAAVWFRSYRDQDGVHVVWSNGNQLSISSGFGAASVRFFRLRDGVSFQGVTSKSWGSRNIRDARPMRGDRFASFQWSRTPPSPLPGGGFTRITTASVPYWAVFATSLAALAVAIIRARQRLLRAQAGGCHQCGYDLTANVSGTCPECGTPIEDAIDINDATTSTDTA